MRGRFAVQMKRRHERFAVIEQGELPDLKRGAGAPDQPGDHRVDLLLAGEAQVIPNAQDSWWWFRPQGSLQGLHQGEHREELEKIVAWLVK